MLQEHAVTGMIPTMFLPEQGSCFTSKSSTFLTDMTLNTVHAAVGYTCFSNAYPPHMHAGAALSEPLQ